ncbi:hypothetical protein AAEH84_20400, partial [Shewanella indica]
MKRFAVATAIAALLASVATLPSLAAEKTVWRLFVSDHAEPIITIIDAISGNKLDTLPLKGPASL